MRTLFLQIAVAALLAVLIAVVWQRAGRDEARAASAASTNPTASADTPPIRTTLPKAAYVDPATFLPEPLCRVVGESSGNVSLREVAEEVTKVSGLPCRIHEYDLENDGVSADLLVTLPGDVPLYLALDQMCTRTAWADRFATPLEWYVEDGIVVVTTESAAMDRLFVQAFDALPALRQWDGDRQVIIDVFQANCDGEWVDLDGIGGEIEFVANALVVRQTFSMLRKSAEMLEAMEQQGEIVYVDRSPADALIDATLDGPVNGWFHNVTLSTAVASLSEQAGIPFELDVVNLDDEGIAEDSLVNCELRDQPLRIVLDAMLEDVNGTSLMYVVRDGVLWITTGHVHLDTLETIFYNVEDLLLVMEEQQIVDLIQAQVSGEWMDRDGIGGEVDVSPGGFLIVTNTRSSHEAVREMLSKLREVVHTSDAEDPNAIVSRTYRLSATLAEDIAPALKELVAPESWADPFQPNSTGRGQLYSLRLDANHTSLIVRQTLENHRTIERLLDRIDPRGYGH